MWRGGGGLKQQRRVLKRERRQRALTGHELRIAIDAARRFGSSVNVTRYHGARVVMRSSIRDDGADNHGGEQRSEHDRGYHTTRGAAKSRRLQ